MQWGQVLRGENWCAIRDETVGENFGGRNWENRKAEIQRREKEAACLTLQGSFRGGALGRCRGGARRENEKTGGSQARTAQDEGQEALREPAQDDESALAREPVWRKKYRAEMQRREKACLTLQGSFREGALGHAARRGKDR